MSDETHVDQLLSCWQRHRARGEDLSTAELCKDRPELIPEVERRLQALRQMQPMMETASIFASGSRGGPGFVAVPGPSTTFVEALQTHGLLWTEHLRIATELSTTMPEANMLADELLARGWLTPYQVGEVSQGRGKELVVGPYLLLEPLGKGGMGQVFRARDQVLDRIVALKLTLPTRFGSSQAVERFMREAKAAALLSHVNIVTIYAAGLAGETFYMAMELLQGCNLAEYLVASGPLPVQEACEYVRQAALGLQHAHEKGMVHRDIKPANLLRTDGGQIKVLDLGLALVLEATTLTHQGGACMGTVDYMAPEQVTDAHHVDIRADVYSLGCTLYHLLAGKTPFGNVHPSARLLIRQEQDPQPIEQHRPDVPTGLAAIVQRMLARRREDRMRTPGEVAEALLPFARATSGKPPAPDASHPLCEQTRTLGPEQLPQRSSHDGQAGNGRLAPVRKWAVPVALFLVALTVGGFVVVPLYWTDKRRDSDWNLESMAGSDQDKDTLMTEPFSVPDDVPREIENSIGMKLAWIPAGRFQMGSPKDEAAREPTDRGCEEQHEVEITKAFYLGVHEVTQKQFKELMGYNPSYFSRDANGKMGLSYDFNPGGGKNKVKDLDSTDDLPVENVSWEEAQTFLEKLSALPEEAEKGRRYTLPTEGEWERACRGGAARYTVFHCGNSLSSKQANFNGDYPYGGADKGGYRERTSKVGSYQVPNRFGLYDMHGNVWEWCSDWYDKDYVKSSPPRDPAGPSEGSHRVNRGGSWVSPGADCRSACRRGSIPSNRDPNLGFRAALASSQ